MTGANGISIGITECVATVLTAVSAEHRQQTRIEFAHSVGGKWMKCFDCESKCITKYHHKNNDICDRVIAVNKVCVNCGWESFPTRVPEPLS